MQRNRCEYKSQRGLHNSALVPLHFLKYIDVSLRSQNCSMAPLEASLRS